MIPHIEIFTQGSEFKDDDKNTWKVTGLLSEGKQMIVNLTKINNEVLEELLRED